MAVGRKFEEALQKALRMVDESVVGLDPHVVKASEEVGKRERRDESGGINRTLASIHNFYKPKNLDTIEQSLFFMNTISWAQPVSMRDLHLSYV